MKEVDHAKVGIYSDFWLNDNTNANLKTGGAGAGALREVNPEDKADAGKKKKKDGKMDAINGENEGDSNMTVETDSKVKQKEKKHKKNEVSREEGTTEIADETAQVEDKGKQEENSNVKLNKSEKKKKSKSTKKDDGLKEGNDEVCLLTLSEDVLYLFVECETRRCIKRQERREEEKEKGQR